MDMTNHIGASRHKSIWGELTSKVWACHRIIYRQQGGLPQRQNRATPWHKHITALLVVRPGSLIGMEAACHKVTMRRQSSSVGPPKTEMPNRKRIWVLLT